MSTSKPVILLFPGAWHKAATYNELINNLDSYGYSCHPVDLPSVDPDPKAALTQTVADDIATVRTNVLSLLKSGQDVVVICHSWSGVPVQAACSALPHDTPGKLVGIGMIAAFLVPPRTSLIDFVGGPIPLHDYDESTNIVKVGPPGPKASFYYDLPDDVADMHVKNIKPHVWASKTVAPEEESLAYLDGVPTSFLVCAQDAAIPPALQRGMVQAATQLMKEKGVPGGIRVEEVDSGHSPFLNHVERTGEFVRRCAGENLPV